MISFLLICFLPLVSSSRVFTSNSQTCVMEVKLRQFWNEKFKGKDGTNIRLAPSMIRSVFHDAIDFNNVVDKDGNLYMGEPSGVDFCLNNPTAGDDRGQVFTSHNRNIPTRFVSDAHERNRRTNDIFDEVSFSDIQVLGSLVAIEEIGGGPQTPFKFGRIDGNCEKAINCHFKEGGCAQEKYIGVAVEGTSLDADHYRGVFEQWGFTPEDQTALMGAHTFGKLAVCAGGFNGIEKGPFCNDPDLLKPPVEVIEDDDVVSVKYNISYDMPTTWTCEKNRGRCIPRWVDTDESFNYGFGDGGAFDMTPMTFDNNYFTLLAETVIPKGFNETIDWCCGKVKSWGCHRKGQITNFKTRARLTGSKCQLDWCRSDRKGRTHFKSMKNYVDMDKKFVKHPHRHGYVKRLILLGGDMALTGNEETRAHVQNFASSEDVFFDGFRNAWKKVINMVSNKDDLQSCHNVPCTFNDNDKTYKCTDTTHEVIFYASDGAGQCKPPAASHVDNCELIGGMGARGIIQCGGEEEHLCCSEQFCANELEEFDDIELGDDDEPEHIVDSMTTSAESSTTTSEVESVETVAPDESTTNTDSDDPAMMFQNLRRNLDDVVAQMKRNDRDAVLQSLSQIEQYIMSDQYDTEL